MNRTILITGTSTGIGYAIAKEFSEANYQVIATIRKVEDAERLKQELNKNVYPVICDVTNQEQVSELTRYVKEISQNGLLDGLINNAAIESVSPIEFQGLEDTRNLFETNLFGLMNVTQTLLPLLGTSPETKKHMGRIINVSSVGGVLALPFLSSYAATKHALEGYSHSLRRELSVFGIKVIILAPGAIKSKIWEKDELDKKSFKASRYEQPFENFKQMMVKAEKGAASSASIARFTRKIFETSSPKVRYTFTPGRFFNWTLPSLLPHKGIDFIFNKMIGLSKK